MSAAAKLLDRLDRVRQTRPGNWQAGCPCCQSRRGRPISIRETDDGRALIHAFCGCDSGAVLGALGLTLGDLFEKPMAHHVVPSQSRIQAREVLSALDHEIQVVAILAEKIAAGAATADELARLSQAAARIGAARDHVCPEVRRAG